MTPDEFWKGSPYLVRSYRLAYLDRQKAKNTDMWLQGMYIYEGVVVAVAKCVCGDKKMKYPDKPYELYEKTEDQKKNQAEIEIQKFIKSMNALKTAWDRNGR